MIALQYEAFGEPAELLRPAEVAMPEPAAGLVRVQMVRSPIHNHDLATIRGVYGVRPRLPAIGGSELLAVADGKRVVCSAQGAWAGYALARADSLIPVPDAIGDDNACQLLAMPLSALILLDELRVSSGDWIAQNAANGAVGRILLREAAARGINVVNLVRSEETAQHLRAFGARHVVVTQGRWLDDVREVTGGAPIVRAVDSVAGAQSMLMQRLLAPRGELIIFGGLAGEPMRLDPSLMISNETIVRGFWMTAFMQREENRPRIAAAMKRVFELAMQGELPLATAGVYSLSEVREAVVASEAPGRTGKILFKP